MYNRENTNLHCLKRRTLEKYFGKINDSQRRAVFHLDGPLLILAGAGSGKTTVLINRIENMVLFGDAYANSSSALSPEDSAYLQSYLNGGQADLRRLAEVLAVNPVRPWNILAITFTNKAAGELRSRLEERLGPEVASDIAASTFHSLCVRILRRESEAAGYGRSFTIYDTDDSLRVIKACVKQAGLDDKIFTPKSMLSAISRAKDELQSPGDMQDAASGDFRLQSIAKVYALYANTLRAANAMDFDDLIVQTVYLFRQNPAVLEVYRRRWRYIMVDEYQDTNHAQYVLISLLSGGHKNLCVVGDDDQSIYKFRGATIENILSFEQQFPGAAVIRLEQNYRSTGNILSAANHVISNNTERKGKNLWTSGEAGEKIRVERANDEEEESRIIADSILENVKAGAKFSDHAVLYRMNAQSNSVEMSLARSAIPYRIIGGVRFYERKEIKDMIAYLTVLHNPSDDLRLSRILNEPKRGIGAATASAAQSIASTVGVSLFQVLSEAGQFEPLAKKEPVLRAFTDMISELGAAAEEKPLDEVLDALLERSGYRTMLENQGFEGAGRLENILELGSNLIRYQQENPEPSLSGFLEEIALYTDIDNYDPSADRVVLMTIHSAKGLEFDNVFIAGMDEGIFPGRSAFAFPAEIEEERRLAYVAITRAKKKLLITSAQRRLIFGQTIYGQPSRFIGEIPQDVIQFTDHTLRRAAAAAASAAARPVKRDYGASTSIGVGGVAAKPDTSLYASGEKVSHAVFGDGLILSVKPMGGDTLLEVDFGGKGIKKIFANFARLSKI